MRALYDALHLIELVVFGVLAITAIYRYTRVRTTQSALVAGAFVLLEAAVVVSQLVPQPVPTSEQWLVKAELVAVIFFPFLLYLFVRSLVPQGRVIDVIAASLTAAVAVWTLFLPAMLPGPAEPRPAWLTAFVAMFGLQWISLSVYVSYQLFSRGVAQPSTARARMHTMAYGAGGLSVSLILLIFTPPHPGVAVTDLLSTIIATCCGPLLLLGVAPPGIMRAYWRQSETTRIRVAEAGLMEARTPLDVTQYLLPQVARLMGSGSAALVSLDGRVVDAIGLSAQEEEDLARRASEGAIGQQTVDETHSEIALLMSSGWLVVRMSPFAPFFGQEERNLLERIAVLADLALQRTISIQRESDNRRQLEEAQQVAAIGSWTWDLATGKIEWSDQLYRNYGLEPGSVEITLDTLTDRVHPEDRRVMANAIREAQENKQGFEFEYRALRPDGAVRIFRAQATPIFDPSGEMVRMIGISQDITEQRNQERLALAQERSLVEQGRLLNLASDGIFVRDLDGSLRFWNQGAERLYGYSAEEVMGRQVADVLKTRYPVPVEDILDEVTREGHWEGELVHTKKDGSTVIVESRWALETDDDGTPKGVLELNTDISERKRHDAARERFIADAAHELRTPLTTLLGFTEVLGSADDLDKRQVEMAFAAMGRAGRRMSSLVNNLLDLSKLTDGRLALDLGPVDVDLMVKDALSAAPAPEGIVLDIDVPEGLTVMGERDRLTQVLSNLLVNAYRYGGDHIEISAVTSSDTVTLTIADNGPGVDEELVPHMFEPFSRSIESSQLGGSGLGLAIVKTLTEACGGKVSYRRAPNGGACFEITVRAA